MTLVLPGREKRPGFLESLLSSAGPSILQGAQDYRSQQMKQEMMRGEEASKGRLLEKEYGLKGNLEERKQAAKFAEQMKMFEKMGINLGDENFEPQEPSQTHKKSPFEEYPGVGKPEGESPQKPAMGVSSKLIPQEKINAMALVNPAVANQMQKKNEQIISQQRYEEEKETKKSERERKEFESERAYHAKRADPIIESAQSVIKEAPIKKGLIDQQRRDIASGKTEGIIPFLVETTGLEFWRNPESARFKTGAKQRFIENLQSISGGGARPNQFIEQQLVSAQPVLGRNAEANQTVLDLEEFIDDMKYQNAKFELELADEDQEKYGYPRNDITQRAQQKMEKYAEERQDKMAYTIRKRHEDRLKDEDLLKEVIGRKVSPDTPLTIRMARLLMIKNNDDEKKAQAEARQLGFKIPLQKTYRKAQ